MLVKGSLRNTGNSCRVRLSDELLVVVVQRTPASPLSSLDFSEKSRFPGKYNHDYYIALISYTVKLDTLIGTSRAYIVEMDSRIS